MTTNLKPCRSPYCECTPGQCSHPGCYDARGEPWTHPKQTTTNTPKPTKMDLKTLLNQTPRLRAWADIGPVQHAELTQFVQNILDQRAAGVTADGFFANPGDRVWVVDGIGAIKPTTVSTPKATTNYYLFGNIPVEHSWMDRQNLEKHLKYNT